MTYVGRRVLWSFLNQMREAFFSIIWFMAKDVNFHLTPLEKKGVVEGFRDRMVEFS